MTIDNLEEGNGMTEHADQENLQAEMDGLPERLGLLAEKFFRTQTEMADVLCTSRQAVNRWLNGKVLPGRNSLKHIAKVTGCNLNWLLTGEGTAFPQGTLPKNSPAPSAPVGPARLRVLLAKASNLLESPEYGESFASTLEVFHDALEATEAPRAPSTPGWWKGLDTPLTPDPSGKTETDRAQPEEAPAAAPPSSPKGPTP